MPRFEGNAARNTPEPTARKFELIKNERTEPAPKKTAKEILVERINAREKEKDEERERAANERREMFARYEKEQYDLWKIISPILLDIVQRLEDLVSLNPRDSSRNRQIEALREQVKIAARRLSEEDLQLYRGIEKLVSRLQFFEEKLSWIPWVSREDGTKFLQERKEESGDILQEFSPGEYGLEESKMYRREMEHERKEMEDDWNSIQMEEERKKKNQLERQERKLRKLSNRRRT